MPRHAGVVAVTCLALEARIARGPGVSVLCNHSLELANGLRAAIARGVSGIISFGIAGGLAPHLAPGDWVVASGVRSGDDLIATDLPWTQRLLDILPGAVHAEVTGADAVIGDGRRKARSPSGDRRCRRRYGIRTSLQRSRPNTAYPSLHAASLSIRRTGHCRLRQPWACVSTARRMSPPSFVRSGKSPANFPISCASRVMPILRDAPCG